MKAARASDVRRVALDMSLSEAGGIARAIGRALPAIKSDGNPPKPAKPTRSDMTLKFGAEKGVPLAKMKTGNLKWARDFLAEQMELQPNSRWHAANAEQLAAIVCELEFRGEG